MAEQAVCQAWHQVMQERGMQLLCYLAEKAFGFRQPEGHNPEAQGLRLPPPPHTCQVGSLSGWGVSSFRHLYLGLLRTYGPLLAHAPSLSSSTQQQAQQQAWRQEGLQEGQQEGQRPRRALWYAHDAPFGGLVVAAAAPPVIELLSVVVYSLNGPPLGRPIAHIKVRPLPPPPLLHHAARGGCGSGNARTTATAAVGTAAAAANAAVPEPASSDEDDSLSDDERAFDSDDDITGASPSNAGATA
eukprot:363661-Chlamydomonas_euryale.AAC.1